MDDRLWAHLDSLIASSEIVIDRPAGSTHPRFPAFVYPLDYGCLTGTSGGDGAGIDVWIGSVPGRSLGGVVLTVDLEKRDAEVKLLLGCTVAEAETILAAHNEGAQSGTLILRPEHRQTSG